MTTKEIDAIHEKLDRADQYLEKSEFAQAKQLVNEVLTARNRIETLSKHNEARAFCILGECAFRTARYDDALTNYKKALDAAKISSNHALQAQSLNGIAAIQNKRDDYNAALTTGQSALERSEKAKDKQQQARALCNLGNAYINIGEYASALDYYTRSLIIAEENGDKVSIAENLNNIGLVNSRLADYPHALNYYIRSLSLAIEIGDQIRISSTLGNIGGVYRNLSDYPLSLEYYTRSLAIAEQVGDKLLTARTLGNIGAIHSGLDDYSRSFEYYSRALALGVQIGSKQIEVSNLSNIGAEYYHVGDYPRSMEYLKKALEISEAIGDRREIGFCMCVIAATQRKLGNLDAAYQGGMDALSYLRNVLKTNQFVATVLQDLGTVMVDQGKFEEGIVWFEEGLALAEELGEKDTVARLHWQISDAYSKIGNLQKAFDHLIKNNALEQEIYSEASKKRVETFNMRVAIADEGREAAVQRLRAEKSEHETATQQLRADAFQQQVIMQASAMSAQSELLEHFRNQVVEIFRDMGEPVAALKKIREKLRDLPKQEINWTKFDADFTQAHPEFRTKLLEKYPDLSEAELRLCMMVKLGLKTPDIARLLCLSERTIEGHRLNARKKMGVKKGDELATKLAQL